MKLCNIDMKRGEKIRCELCVEGTDLYIPVYLFCGAKEGKTLVITAGVHGCEYVGIQTARQLIQELKTEELQGQVIIVPMVNQEGFYKGVKQIVPADCKNLNRVFPGSVSGSMAEKIAYIVEHVLYEEADFLVDLHGGDINEMVTSHIYFPCAVSSDVMDMSKNAAAALSCPYRVRSTVKNGLYSYAAQCGIPSFLLEHGGAGKWSTKEVELVKQNIYELLGHLEIILFHQTEKKQIEIEEAVYEETGSYGFWYPLVKEGEIIRKGTLLGELRDDKDHLIQAIYAKFDGVVLYYTISLGVSSGDSLIAYGRV